LRLVALSGNAGRRPRFAFGTYLVSEREIANNLRNQSQKLAEVAVFWKRKAKDPLDIEFKRESQKLRREIKVHQHTQRILRGIHHLNQRREQGRVSAEMKKPLFTLVLVKNQQAMDDGIFHSYLVQGWKNLILTYLDLLSQYPTNTVWVFRGSKNSLEDMQHRRTVSTGYILRKMREKYLHDRMSKYC
jgi:hypothetical protein